MMCVCPRGFSTAKRLVNWPEPLLAVASQIRLCMPEIELREATGLPWIPTTVCEVPVEPARSLAHDTLEAVAFASTNASVAIFVLLSPSVCVGAVGLPVNAGEASGALAARSVGKLATSPSASATAPVRPATVCTGARPGAAAATKAVVAILVLLSVDTCVGAVGLPVKAGEARGALAPRSVLKLVTSR